MSDLNLSIRIRANADGSLSVINGVGNSIHNAGRQADQAQNAMERLSSSIARVGHYAAGAFAGSWAGSKISEVVMLADNMTLLDGRIKIATASQADYLSSSKELVAISLRTGTSFDANATIFARINKAMEQMGGTTRHTTALTEALAQSLRISGTSAGEAASVIRQMSQALASGVLRGDEFNSLMENSPRVSQALADGMNVGIGALRAMAEAGELTSKRVIDAIQSQSAVINEEFKKIPLTVGAAMENINTAFGQYVLSANKGAGATAGLAANINVLAHNLTPVVDGLVTLGKVAAAVYAGKLVASIGAYSAAQVAALTVERAHAAAIAQNLQVNIARASATVAQTSAQVADIAMTEGAIIANRALTLARLQSTNTTIAQAQATIAATSATIQSTVTLYLNRQATQQLAIAEQARSAVLTELGVLGRQQAAISAQLTAAQAAQTAATAGLTAAQEAATVASTGFIASLTLANVAMGALNIAMGAVIGWQLGVWLREFTPVQNAATLAVNYYVKTLETLNYAQEKAVLLLHGNIDAARQLRIEHQSSMAAHDALTASIIETNEALSQGSVMTGAMAADLESLRTPQEVYNQKLSEANEAAKTLDATTGKMLITEEKRLELGAKALKVWQQANAEEQNAKLSEAGKEVEKLQAQYDKLAMKPEDYNKQHAQSLSGLPAEKAAVESLSNAILKLQEGKKALAKEDKESESAAKKAANEAVKSEQKALDLLQSLAEEQRMNMLSSKEKELQIALTRNLKDVTGEYRAEVELITRQIYSENEARARQQAMWDESISQANALAKLRGDAGYAEELVRMAKALQLQGFSNAAIKEQIDLEKQKKAAIEANINLPASQVSQYTTRQTTADQQLGALTSAGGNQPAPGVQQKETTETARVALEAYNKSLDDARVKTSDLGAVTSAIFDGALGGINTMAGAFDNMVNSINNSSLALQENAKMKVLNETTIDPVAKAANAKKYANEELILNNKILTDKLSGTRQIAGAVSSMLKQGSTEQRAAHAIEMGIAGMQMAQTLIKITGIGAEAAAHTAAVVPFVTGEMVKGEAAAATGIATQAAAGPYIGFALMAAMAIAMAAIGFGSGGSASIPAQPATSSDTGTVLGDPTAKSQSIDKTYQLLKDIHAEEYAELRGINAGIGNLKSAITGTITAIFQAGGLVSVATKDTSGFLGFNSSKQSISASGINTGSISVADVMAGMQVSGKQFDTVQTDKSSWWGLSKSTSFETYTKKLDSSITDSIGKVFNGMGASMLQAAKLLGGNLEQSVRDYVIPAMNVDLKGLNGEDAAKKLNGVISAALDTMATAVFGDIIGQYQQLGEGMLETAVRIVSEVAVVKDALATSGLSLASNAIAISDALVQAAGGLQEFQKQFEAYYDKFYSDSEKQVRLQTRLASQLGDVNLVLASSREGYRQQLEALDLANAADQQRYSLLLSLASAADTYYTGLETAQKAVETVLLNATNNAYTLLQNAVTLQKDAATKVRDAISGIATTLTSTLTKLQANAPDTLAESRASAQSQLKSMLDLMQSGGLPNQDKLTQVLEAVSKPSEALFGSYTDYKRDYYQTAGDIQQMSSLANGQLSTAEQTLVTLDAILTNAKAQLDALNGNTVAVLSIKDALTGFNSAVTLVQSAKIPGFATGGKHKGGWREVGETGRELEYTGPSQIFNRQQSKSLVDNTDVVAVINALRDEVSLLRSEARATASHTNKTARILERVMPDGDALAVRVLA